MPMIIDTPKPPYYAVIFTSIKIDEDKGYRKMSNKMVELVSQQDGFLGFEFLNSTVIRYTVDY